MFDNPTPSSGQQPQPASQPSGQPGAGSAQPQQRPAAREPEDIFATTDAARPAAPPTAAPPRSGGGEGSGMPVATSAPAAAVAAGTASGGAGNRRYLIIGIVAIGALLVILVAMVVLAYTKAQEANKVTEQLKTGGVPADTTDDTDAGEAMDNDTTDEAEDTGDSRLPVDETKNGNDTGEQSQFILDEITDSDGDGLTDGEEKRLGTNPNSEDTDNDGLFDRQEVRIYRTDPTNADTDNDGYTDGEEVDNGYNPKGDGKLYELP